MFNLKDDQTKLWMVGLVCGTIVLVMSLVVMMRGCEISADQLDHCIHDTQKPLECKASFRQ